jgi:tetratricopeptide (TPR) repeat protein
MAAQTTAGEQRAHARYVTAVKNFEAGVRFFQKQNYEKAKEVFEKLAAGSVHEVANRAETYLRLCEQKLGRTVLAPKTAADYYNLGVAELNARNLNAAVEYLNKADRLAPNQDHVRYALAAAHTLLGNVDSALQHLKAAIGLRAANRFLASRDDDFRSLAADPRFRQLLRPEVS